MSEYLLSIVVPCFNEELTISDFFKETNEICQFNNIKCEFIFIGDGSSDNTLNLIFFQGLVTRRFCLVLHINLILFCSGVQLFTIGILGQYISKIYTELKNHPHYIIKEAK